MNVRRTAAVLTAAVTWMSSAPAAVAAPSPSPSVALPSGLYGSADPTYDGVFRQSYALLAQHTAGVRPAVQAVDWLTDQQCADGGFAAFRPDTDKACDTKTGVDSNSTAAAVQALAALGGQVGSDAVSKAVTWLKSVQNKDGGWGYNPGLDSDANSTGIVVGALAAAGEKPSEVRSADGGKSPYDALPTLALPCADGGGFGLRDAKSGKLEENADATAAGVLGGLGKGLVASAGTTSDGDASCQDADKLSASQAAANGALYLEDALTDDGYLMSSLPGAKDQPDYGNTADAVVALAAAGHTDSAARSLKWLGEHATDWAEQSGPAAWAQLVFAAHAAGADPRDLGGTDLVSALNATGPAPQKAAAGSAADDGETTAEEDDGGSFGVWWIVGVFLIAGIGIGFLLSGRNKRRP